MNKFTLSMVLALTLSACKYSNTFTGTYQNEAASMTAYSGNISRYCIALSLSAGAVKKTSSISGSLLFDPNDFLKTTAFNTKGTACDAGLAEYLVGTRSTTVLGVSTVYQEEHDNYNFDFCRSVYYKQYQYKEQVTVDFKNNLDDQLVGSFVGTGEVGEYVDYDHPVNYGPIYYCGPYQPFPPFPPYPHPPYPPYPHPPYPPYPPHPHFK